MAGSARYTPHTNLVKNRDTTRIGLGDADLVMQLLEEGRAADAVELARACVSRCPTAPELWLALGRALVVQGDLREASRVLLEGTMLAPADVELSAWLAQALLHLDESDRAVRVLQRVICAAGINERLAELFARAHLDWGEKKRRMLSTELVSKEPPPRALMAANDTAETRDKSEEDMAETGNGSEEGESWEALLARAKAAVDGEGATP